MSERLWFERLELERLPGLERGGFTLDGLSPGVNVIHGPNGSGKTTTARAIDAFSGRAAVGNGPPTAGGTAGSAVRRGRSSSTTIAGSIAPTASAPTRRSCLRPTSPIGIT